MTPEDKLKRLQTLLEGFFMEARRQHQARKLEPKSSTRKPVEQVPHPFDHVVDVVCRDLDLPNPGTDQHSFNVWPHPVDGWPPEVAERMRRERIRQTWERARPEDKEWLEAEGLTMTKDGWVRFKESGYGG